MLLWCSTCACNFCVKIHQFGCYTGGCTCALPPCLVQLYWLIWFTYSSFEHIKFSLIRKKEHIMFSHFLPFCLKGFTQRFPKIGFLGFLLQDPNGEKWLEGKLRVTLVYVLSECDCEFVMILHLSGVIFCVNFVKRKGETFGLVFFFPLLLSMTT